MKKIYLFALLAMVFIIVAGCSSGGQNAHPSQNVAATANPNAKEILSTNPEADIFQWNGLIYETGIEWLEKQKLTKGQQVGEITESYSGNGKFIDGMATKLPIGAKIFFAMERGDTLIVESDGKVKKYLALVEG